MGEGEFSRTSHTDGYVPCSRLTAVADWGQQTQTGKKDKRKDGDGLRAGVGEYGVLHCNGSCTGMYEDSQRDYGHHVGPCRRV